MDVASKYKDLPGIAYDQPDVYETNDLPEADQPRKTRTATDDVSSNVDIIPVNPDAAFKKFEGKQIKISGVDFTNYPFGSRGYQTWGDWEVLPIDQKDEETPLQRYRRIRTEIANLQESLKGTKLQNNKGDSSNLLSGDLTVSDIINHLDDLNSTIQSLDCESWLENVVSQTSSKSLATIERQLIQAGNTADETKKIGKFVEPSSSSSSIVYELRCRPEQTRASQSSLVSSLERKVRNLELIVGEADKSSLLTSSAHNKTLYDAVQELSKKVTLMDAHHLEQLDSRLNSLHQKVTTLSDKKTSFEETEKNVKIKEIIDLIHETEPQRASLPIIASRLQSLSEIEEQAAHFSGAISYIDSVQSQITNDLKTSQEDLKSMKENLAQSMTLFKKRMEEFEQRLEALK